MGKSNLYCTYSNSSKFENSTKYRRDSLFEQNSQNKKGLLRKSVKIKIKTKIKSKILLTFRWYGWNGIAATVSDRWPELCSCYKRAGYARVPHDFKARSDAIADQPPIWHRYRYSLLATRSATLLASLVQYPLPYPAGLSLGFSLDFEQITFYFILYWLLVFLLLCLAIVVSFKFKNKCFEIVTAWQVVLRVWFPLRFILFMWYSNYLLQWLSTIVYGILLLSPIKLLLTKVRRNEAPPCILVVRSFTILNY